MGTTPSNLLGTMPIHSRTPLGNAPRGAKLPGTSSNGTVILSVLLSGMAAEFQRPLEALHNNLGPNGGDLGAAFQGLSQGQQSQLRQTLGSSPLTELFSLARLPQGRRFAAGLYRWASRQEAEGQLALAGTAYQILQNLPEAGSLKARASHRLNIFQGGGSFGERFSFQINPMMKQIIDPAFFGSMLVGGGMFHLARGTAVNALRGMSLGGLTRSTGFLRSASWVAAVTAEAPAFALSHHGLNHLMGRTPPPGAPGLGKEILSAGITLSALRLGGIGTRAVLGHGARTLGAASPFVRASSVVLPQFGMYTGILGAQVLGSHLDLHPASKTPLSDSLITLFHFNMAGMALNAWTGGRYSHWTHQTERKMETQFQEHSLWNGNSLLGTPAFAMATQGSSRGEPTRAPQRSWQMNNAQTSGDGETPSPRSPELDMEAHYGIRIQPGQKATLPSRETYIPVRYHFSLAEGQITDLLGELSGKSFWYHQAWRVTRDLNVLFQTTHREMQENPSAKEHLPILEEIIRQLDQALQVYAQATPPAPEKTKELFFLDWTELEEIGLKYRHYPKTVRIDGGSLKKRLTLIKVQDLLTFQARIPNIMINYLFSGDIGDLQGVLINTATSSHILQRLLARKTSVPKTTTPDLEIDPLRRSLHFQSSPPTQYPRAYEFTNNFRGPTKDIFSEGNRVLLTGNLDGIRENIFAEQHVESHRINGTQLTPLMHRLASMGTDVQYRHIDRESPTFFWERYSYLEAYDPIPAETLTGPQAESQVRALSSKLKPGGIGYLVHENPEALTRMVEILTENNIGDIIEASLNSPLPIASTRPDAKNSNYLFFRKLPYSRE